MLNNNIEVLYARANYNTNSIAIFNKLCGNRPATLLLESAEIDKKNDIESIIIIDSALRITSLGQTVIIKAISRNGYALLLQLKNILPKTIKIINYQFSMKLLFPLIDKNLDEDARLRSLSVFDCLRSLLKLVNQPPNMPKAMFFGGLFSYDLISVFENIPILQQKQHCPDYCFYLAETLLTINHQQKNCELQCSLFRSSLTEKNRLQHRLKELQYQINQSPELIQHQIIDNMKLTYNHSNEEYRKIIRCMQQKIIKGEIFQVVPSRRFFLPCPSTLAAYSTLKNINPSPYMFYMQDNEFTLFGASPERSLKYDPNTRQIEICPIAGTRIRGRHIDGTLDVDLDSRIELNMRSDHKELAEHLMLVDLARNDLARICDPGTRYVADLIKVDRYSFVMHLVSRVIGKLRSDLDMLHAYLACMNMGTLSGTPKIRAMQIIAEVEGERRGSYGGAIGYFTATGILDTCIVIRSAYVENNIATVQSGAGIVLDSIPQNEVDESINKARAVLHAIATAHEAKDILNGRYFTT
ncbi:Anthranilate synthase component 1 [secondary endosymbiont of Trabutina mannipara]|uniref:Anthranilate synthase component 1 n=1 Tax=secondary endosymbiont of Trabutina mannipara TaxID=1835721 RepID=A0A1C3L3P8_9ENTR|nr:anthranilate synthase component 1 [secondary endosymbiont of Trabutina mannipara]SBT81896.1 Anthranilate synthase component 1 [secondary endosymbiont of Trabutina mannipara]